jgi:hypothetical protein
MGSRLRLLLGGGGAARGGGDRLLAVVAHAAGLLDDRGAVELQPGRTSGGADIGEG